MTQFKDNNRIAVLELFSQVRAPTIDLFYSFRANEPVVGDPTFTIIAHDEWNKRTDVESEPKAERLDGQTFRFKQQLRRDTVRVRVDARWTTQASGELTVTDVVHLHRKTFLNAQSTVPVKVPEPLAPRLVIALTEAPVPDPTQRPDFRSEFRFETPGAAEVSHILEYVWERLEEGLVKAWRHANVQAGRQPLDFEEVDLEEKWARLITEKLIGAAYVLPVNAYQDFNGKGPGNSTLLGHLQESTIPGISLATECQQSCDIAAVTRGFKYTTENQTTGRPIVTALTLSATGASGNGSPLANLQRELPPADRSTWKTNKTDLAKNVQPGTMYGFKSTVSGKQGAGSHIAFVLRVVDRPDGQAKTIQLLDTGGVEVEQPLPPLLAKAEPKQNPPGPSKVYDYPTKSVTIGTSKTNFDGYAVLPPNQELLQQGVERLERTRPLGLVRLAILKRPQPGSAGDQELVYASPLLRTYTKRSRDNFALSRLLWAIRNHPGNEHLEVWWLIDTPRRELAFRMLDDRTATARELFSGLPGIEQARLPLVDLRSLKGGGVELVRGFRMQHVAGKGGKKDTVKQHLLNRVPVLKNLPTHEAKAVGFDPAQLGSVPPYFRDENP